MVDYLVLHPGGHPITLAHLKSDKVRTAGDDERFSDRWVVYKCITAEIDLNGLLFVLASGNWYAVVSDFVERVNQAVAEIPISAIVLPPYQPGETEGAYNHRAADGSEELHLFDRSMVTFEGERGKVEFCDLLSNHRQIIHVKRRGRSSLLSHLFMQGYVAAEAFIDYKPLRSKIRNVFPHLQHLIPEENPTPSDYEIVYALLHEGQMHFPFFSKVALMSIFKQLRRMNYRVGITWVGAA
jgi:uncharacterized protein (TIGR04141 family)